MLPHGLRKVLISASLLLSFGTPAWSAAPTNGGGDASSDSVGTDPIVGADTGVDVVQPFAVEHRFFFRFRPELLGGGSLGPAETGVPSGQLTIDGVATDSTMAWASMRFRYEPIFKLGSQLEIHIGVEALRNLILGTTHVNAGGDFNQGLWDDAAGVPAAGINAFQDALEIRHLYGYWRAFDLVDVYGGRMVDHWGLGILRHDGRGDDSDYGSVIDQVKLGVSFGDIRIEASLEFTNIGATTANPYEPFGQPKDLGQDDDVSTYTMRVFSRPTSEEQIAARAALLSRKHVGFDWGALLVFTDQTYDSQSFLAANRPTGSLCRPLATTRQGTTLWGDTNTEITSPNIQDTDCYQLVPRDAFFFKPSLWARWEWHPDLATKLTIEWEFAMVLGSVTNLQNGIIEGFPDTSKDWLSVGSALEVELKIESFKVGLLFGIATGDERRFLGYSDGQNISTANDDAYETTPNVNENKTVESYWFHRDYKIDLILFRQVIGGVTNAVYVKPYVGYDLSLGDVKLTTQLDFLYAAAVDPDGTPGQGRHYGVEIDAHLGLEYDSFGAGLSGGVLIPMNALANRDTGAQPEVAYTVMGLFTWRYE